MTRTAVAWMIVALICGAGGRAFAQPEELLDWDAMAPDQRALQLVQQAQEALAAGEYGQAEQLCLQAITGYRQGLLAYWVLWRIREEQERADLGAGTAALADEWRGEWKAAPQDPIASFKAGIVDESEEKYGDAAEKYQAVLDSAFDDAIVYARLGVVQERLGRDEEAAQNLETALKLDPSLEEPYEALPRAYMAMEQWSKAETGLQQLLASRPDDPDLLYQLAVAQAAQGKTLEGLRSVMKATGHEPGGRGNMALAWWGAVLWATRPTWLAAVLLWLIPTALVVPLWWLASREPPGLPDAWFAGVNLIAVFVLFSPVTAARLVAPGNAWHQLMVMYLWAVPFLPLVLAIDAVLDRVLKRTRTKTSAFAGFIVVWLIVVGLNQLTALRSEYRLNWWAFVGVGLGGLLVLGRGAVVCDLAVLLHRKKQRYDKAISWLKAALRLDRSKNCRARAFVNLGDISWLKGDLEAALRYSERAVALDLKPASGVAAANVAFHCAEMGRHDAAVSFVEKARSLCGTVGPFAALPDVAYAYVMMHQGQHYYALQALDVAGRKTGVSKETRTTADAIRGRCLAMLGDFQTATTLCEQVIRNRDYPQWRSFAHTTMGIMWTSSGDL
ncbi:MAG: tetratricopeptide repeat protein, partial [Armatimonadota bacterium]